MRPPFLVLIFFLLSASHAFSQLTGNPSTDIQQLLKPGRYSARLYAPDLTSIASNPQQQQLMAKIAKAREKNAIWFRDTLPTLSIREAGDAMLEKMGVTQEEIMSVSVQAAGKPRVVLTGTDSFTVESHDHHLSFHGQRQLAALDSLSIDIDANIVVFRGKKMIYEKMYQNDSSEYEILGRKASVHSYKYESTPPSNPTMSEMMNNIESFNFNLGVNDHGEIILGLVAVRIGKANPLQVGLICLITPVSPSGN